MLVKTGKASKITGLHPNTLRKYAEEGKIPHKKDSRGNRLYDVSSYENFKSSIICYARVSTPKQKGDLERQCKYLSNAYPSAEIIKDIGSGLNFKRKGLQSILERAMRGECVTVVVSYRDRLARFGFGLIEWIILRSKGKIVVLNQIDSSPTEELTADLMAIITVFSSRLHGLRNYRNKIKADIAPSNNRAESEATSMDGCL